ncbi:hypothetical protein JHK85_051801 [Glycine max]|nr:hypothetical protein JHK85_051801 [Glycine max]
MPNTRVSWLLENRIPSRYRTPSHTHLTPSLSLLTHFHYFSPFSFFILHHHLQSHPIFFPQNDTVYSLLLRVRVRFPHYDVKP